MDIDQANTLHPIGETADLGVWAITVAEVVAGDEAASLMIQTNGENPPAPDGQVYVCVRITAQNTSEQTRAIQVVDFAGTGGDGVLRRTQAVVVPEPMLQAVVEPGASTEGWIAITVADPSVAALWFDSPVLGGSWADGLFALAEGATAPVVEELDASDTDIGSDPGSPAAIGETVKVGGWEVTVQELIYGMDVFDIADFRTRALGSDNSGVPRWIGIYASVRNLNPFPAFFSDIGFEIADAQGEAWDHTMTLTAPDPDVSREYLPGAGGEGWALFEPGSYATADLIRVQPFKIGGAARFISLDGNQPVSDDPDETEDTTATEAPENAVSFAVGDVAVTSEDLVNLREEPSASGTIVSELALGTELEITGESTEADNYTWYPVVVTESGEEGFVVQNFLAPAGN